MHAQSFRFFLVFTHATLQDGALESGSLSRDGNMAEIRANIMNYEAEVQQERQSIPNRNRRKCGQNWGQNGVKMGSEGVQMAAWSQRSEKEVPGSPPRGSNRSHLVAQGHILMTCWYHLRAKSENKLSKWKKIASNFVIDFALHCDRFAQTAAASRAVRESVVRI